MKRLIMCMAPFIAGCSTIIGTAHSGPRLFVGIRTFHVFAWSNLFLAVLDLPLTIAADLTMLPISIFYELAVTLSQPLW